MRSLVSTEIHVSFQWDFRKQEASVCHLGFLPDFLHFCAGQYRESVGHGARCRRETRGYVSAGCAAAQRDAPVRFLFAVIPRADRTAG